MRTVYPAAAVVVAFAGAAAAQVSPLYLGDWTSGQTWVVQNGQIINQFQRTGPSDGPGMAVADTVRFIGQEGGQVGREYGLDGTLLGGVYVNPEYEDLYDGATDGKSFNWSIAHNDFDEPQFPVVVGDREWGGLQVAFVPQRRSSGITYDAVNNSLWVTNTVGSADRVQQYSLDGSLLSEFGVNIPGGYAIAWDPADDTLWVIESFGQPRLHQYAKDGSLLGIVTVQGISNTVLGAEFAVPAPGAAMLAAAGLVLGVRRRRSFGLGE